MLELAILIIFPLAMFYSAASDMLSMTISNKVSIVLIVGFMVLSMAIGMSLQEIAWHWAIAAIVLVVGIGFFAAGWVGGGDVKLAAATALWLGWDFTLPYLVFASFAGGLLTFGLLIVRSRLLPLFLTRFDWINRLHRKGEGVPYGIALGPVAALIYLQTPWMQYVFESAGR